MYRTLALAASLAVCLAGAGSAQVRLFQFDGASETPVGRFMDLGTAAPGDTLEVRFRVRNTGSGAVNFQTLSLAGFGFAITAAPSLPYVLAPGSAADFRVAFNPAAAGSYSANLQVNSLAVVLSGKAVAAAALYAEGASNPLGAGVVLDFGSAERGSSKLRAFRLANTGADPVQVSAVTVAGAGFRGPVGLAAPLQLAPGDSAAFQIAFEPQTAQRAQAALAIDGRTFQLTGLGLDPALPAASIRFDSAAGASATQPKVSIPLAAAAKTAGTGTLILEFHPSAPGAADDPAVQFLSGPRRAATVTIAPGDTQAKFGAQTGLAFQTGTTAGTILFTLQLPSGNQQASYVVAPAPIGIDSATGVRRAGDLDVSITGFDNTHSASGLTFTFYDNGGKPVAPGAIAVDAAGAFRAYFTAGQAGGMFALRATFPVSGDASQVAGVDVQLTNAAGVARTQRISF